MEAHGYFCSALRCCIPCLWPSVEGMRGRRREKIAELEKKMVFCWCLQGPRQMVSHRRMPWAGRAATTAIALVAGSLPQLTVWPGQLSLSPSLLFTDFSRSGQLAVDGSWYLSLLAAVEPVSRWLKGWAQDGQKRQTMKEELWRKDTQKGIEKDWFLGPCTCNGCDWEGCQWGSHGAIVIPYVQWGCVTAAPL